MFNARRVITTVIAESTVCFTKARLPEVPDQKKPKMHVGGWCSMRNPSVPDGYSKIIVIHL